MIHSKVFYVLLSDLMFWQIIFVSYHQNTNIRLTELSDFFYPLFDVFKCYIFSQVKYDNCSDSSSIVSWSECSELLLSCSIPDLIFDPIFTDFNGFSSKLNPDGGFRVKTELIINKSWEYLCFSYIGVTNNNSFKQEIVIFLNWHLFF